MTLGLVSAGLLVPSAQPAGGAALGSPRDLPALSSGEAPGLPASEPSEAEASFESPPSPEGASEAGEDADGDGTAEPRRPEMQGAVVEHRDAFTDVITEADGDKWVRVALAPRNFRDANGEWQPIDPTLARGGDGSFSPRSASATTRVAGQADDPELVSVGRDGWSIRYGLDGAGAVSGAQEQPATPAATPYPTSGPASDPWVDLEAAQRPASTSAPSAMHEQVRFVDALTGVDLVYQLTGTSVEELVIVKARPTAPVVFRFPLQLTGVEARAEADGGVGFYDTAGERVAVMPPATAFDATADDVPVGTPGVTSPVAMRIEGDMLVLEPDAAWMSDPARSYPVAIDPSVRVNDDNASASDAFGYDQQPNDTWNGSEQLKYYAACSCFYYINNAGAHISGQYASWQQFAVPSFLTGTQIKSATWSSLVRDASESEPSVASPFTFLYPMSIPWDANTVDWGYVFWVQPREVLYAPVAPWSRTTGRHHTMDQEVGRRSHVAVVGCAVAELWTGTQWWRLQHVGRTRCGGHAVGERRALDRHPVQHAARRTCLECVAG